MKLAGKCKILILSTLFITAILIIQSSKALALHHKVFPRVCKAGLYEDPRKQFSLYVFCDDAAGTTIGAIKTSAGDGVYDKQGNHIDDHAWRLENRFWQEEAWGRDVESFEWSPDGLGLTVITSPIYGTGTKYELDLARKKIINQSTVPQ